MAIQAVSAIAAGHSFARVGRVLPVPPVVRREEGGTAGAAAASSTAAANDAAPAGATASASTGRGEAAAGGKKAGLLDRRGPGELLGRAELERRLVELRAEKAQGERKRSQVQDARSLDVARVIGQLAARDVHVRAHEAAHIGAGGGYVRGGASYSYQKGPDGREYAVGGEVGIDTSPVAGNPAATAAKMAIVRAAATAPSDPSPADLSIAAAATEMMAAALAELAAARSATAAKAYAAEGSRAADQASLTAEGASRPEDEAIKT